MCMEIHVNIASTVQVFAMCSYVFHSFVMLCLTLQDLLLHNSASGPIAWSPLKVIAFLETLLSCSNSRNAKAIALAWQDVGNIPIIDELEHVTNIRHSSRYQQDSIFPGQRMSNRWLKSHLKVEVAELVQGLGSNGQTWQNKGC